MSKTKVAVYLALIFIAGAIAGGAVVMSSPQTFLPAPPQRPHRSPEEFANHLWDQIKDRLKLTDEQAAQIEPIFRTGFTEVRAIQDRSLQEVEAAIRKNHEEIGQLLTDDQKLELQKMNQEREEFFKKRGHRPPHRPPPS
jgi:hypothetical protein